MNALSTVSESGTALVLANGFFRDPHGKTAHALVRGPSRYKLLGVIDGSCSGRDAGGLLDGNERGIPVFETVGSALAQLAEKDLVPSHCIIGVATGGGVLPPQVRQSLLEAARAGMTLVNGLHTLLADDPEIAREAGSGDAAAPDKSGIIDIRAPRPVSELKFWSGEVLSLETPVVPVLGTDCAIGKRTTSWLLRSALAERGVAAEIVYTGQTGWLQGAEHGFILDATPNDFVTGELERAILACASEEKPDLILVEGQSALRNPSGPCGSELIVSTGARGVVLQHAPGRKQFIDVDAISIPLPSVREEIELIRLLGAEVWVLTLHSEGLGNDAEQEHVRAAHAADLGLPVALPLRDGARSVAEVLYDQLELGSSGYKE